MRRGYKKLKYNIIITLKSENDMDYGRYKIRPSKHFILTWMRKWEYDMSTVRSALGNAYKTEHVGKQKYEAYVRHRGKSRKFIFIKDEAYKELFIITGAEGT